MQEQHGDNRNLVTESRLGVISHVQLEASDAGDNEDPPAPTPAAGGSCCCCCCCAVGNKSAASTHCSRNKECLSSCCCLKGVHLNLGVIELYSCKAML